MFLFCVLSSFKKGETIQGGTLFKGGHYLRKYGNKKISCNLLLPFHLLLGATTIRAFKQDQRFTLESENRVDANVRCNYYNYCSNRWLAIRIEILGNIIVFFAALFCIIDRENLTPGKAGLSISYAMQITDTLTWMVRVFHIYI